MLGETCIGPVFPLESDAQPAKTHATELTAAL